VAANLVDKKKTILVADDDPVVRKMFKTFLTGDGYTVRIAKNGQEAIDEALANQPDLIFMDVVMPELDGFEALQKLQKKRKTKNIPVIIITSRTDTMTLMTALRLGATDFMAKPFMKRDLFRKMNYALMSRQEKQQITDEILIKDYSTFVNGKAFDRMREHFIVNFENIYIKLLKLISHQNKAELKKVLSRLLEAINFFKLNMIKGQLVQLMLAIKTAEWEQAVAHLEAVYQLFQDLQQTLPDHSASI